jgi:nucleotide-binding universal stress UspA family protein/enoyl-CoA hydratase/carnithine racemase
MRTTPRRILVPTDLSPHSERALELATGLAAPFGAEVHLLHVRTSIDSPVLSREDLGEIENILSSSDSRAQRALEDAIASAAVPVSCQIKRGITPVAAILDAIVELRCDLVIMGTQGRRGLQGILIGSVAREVLRRSPVPVLTTRAETTSTIPPRRILVAYDTSEPSLEAVRTTAAWATSLEASVTLLHVVESVAFPDIYGFSTPRESQMERIVGDSLDALTQVGAAHLVGVEHEPRVLRARPADGIARHALDGGFDLVVIATRGLSGVSRTLFGSVADRVTLLSEVPVLTVRGRREATDDEQPGVERPRSQARRTRSGRRPEPSFSVERSPEKTILRLHEREMLAGADLSLVSDLWDLLDREARNPRPMMVVLGPHGLFDPANLEKLVGGPADWDGPTAVEISRRIIREENVIQRFVKAIRTLDSFVVGAVGGRIALHLAAPLLVCDYRIVASDTVFVNTTQAFPRAPLGCMPWLLTRLVGGASATRILLDVPSLSATDALDLGMVNHLAHGDGIEAEALEVADRIASLNRATLFTLKRAIRASADDFETYLQEERATVERISSPHSTVLRA